MKAAMYLRVSTEEQREKQSIETQRTFAESYVQHRITRLMDGMKTTV